MATFSDMLGRLRKAERQLESQIVGVRGAIAALGGKATVAGGRQTRSHGVDPRSGGTTRRGKRGQISADGRARIAAAQKARWAKLRAQKK